MQQDGKKTLKILLISGFFLFIVAFAFYTSYDLLFGVKIKNVSIVDNATLTESLLKITGNAKHAAVLTLNGREISINKQGDFEETIALLPGYNIVSIEAKDKFGSIDQKNYKLIYEAEVKDLNGLPEPETERSGKDIQGPENQ